MKTYRKALTSMAGVLGAMAIWELGSSWWEVCKAERGYDYWRTYYDPATLERSDRIRQSYALRSTGVTLHLDCYPGPQADSPVVIFNHGAAGYCRILMDFALLFNAKGYTVIMPDQRSQGLSGGRRGDYAASECVQNIVDVAQWAKTRFPGPLFMAGGSMGGALTYYAAAEGAPVEAIACLNLFDFGNGMDSLEISWMAPLNDYPALRKLLLHAFGLIRPLHWLRLPFDWFGHFGQLMDARDAEFQKQWDADPVPPRLVTLRSLFSFLNTSPAVPFEENQFPVLVINQGRDRMTDPAITRRNYERLGGEKEYLEIPFGHWSNQPEFRESIVQACDHWFRKHSPLA